MIYVFDSNSLIALGSFYPSRFPTLWASIDGMIAAGTLISVREAHREIDAYADTDVITDWAKRNSNIFAPPSASESLFVAQIFSVPHFRTLISRQSMLEGRPVADPFVVAAARHYSGCVVTEERLRPHAAKIPNVCVHFSIPYMNLEQFMDMQGWKF
jgi:hypothetical protein